MASWVTNPKSKLNPSASPYMRAATNTSPFLPPNSEVIVLHSKLAQLPHEVYGSHPQQQQSQSQSQSQLVLLTRPMANGVVAGFPVYHCFTEQHQFTQTWVYQETSSSWYNVHKQPCTVPYLLPNYYSEGRGQEDLEESDGVKFELEKVKRCHSGVLGHGEEKRVFSLGGRSFVAPPRLRAKRRTGVGFSGEKERRWLPKSDGPDEIQLGGNTTLMIKNVPYHFGRRDLLRILDMHCLGENQKVEQPMLDGFRSEYDFFYLPMDFVRHANLGYAFVNFTNVVGASRFWKAFNNLKWNAGSSKKICEISLADIQGKDALCSHYKNSLFPCHTNEYLPVVLLHPRDGERESRPRLVGRRVDPFSPKARGLPRRRKSLNK